ncbi:MAG: Sensor protein QseC [Paracidovorax wautersii]|uniref:histidine kinase n=1 Tax=Paracidovorax wautersii TaxID=1177982 RepID=A0A7V8JRI2_9BURK|nr:MAG: Sensor protein QseC [Paracidovorax wautersii]
MASAAPVVRRRPARSLRTVLLGALGLLFALATVALYAGARSYGARAADRSYDHLLQSSALSMADSVTFVQGQWQVDLPYAALDLLAMAPQDRAYYRIVAPDGRTITGYGDLPAGEGGAAWAAGVPRFFTAPYRGEPVRFVQIPRYISGSPGSDAAGEPVWVQVGQTRQARDELADDIVWRAWVFIGTLMLAAFALLSLAVHWALRPLARLQHELATRPASDLGPVATPVPRELQPVVAALDDFMGRLAVNLDALRTFIAEAAHQMRTPLAALIAQAQEGLDDDAPGRPRQALEAVERNALRLRRLVNQLLSDASVSHQGHLRQFEAVDVRALLRQAAREVVPRADPQMVVRLAWDEETAAPARVRGDALMLREAFKNLIDNALKYGRPQDGPVEVALSRLEREGLWQVAIRDHGPGIAPARREAVFERFVRDGGGAGEGGGTPGAGLGLAIVRRVIDSHGGRIALGERPDGRPGLVVTIDLPALQEGVV